MKLICHSPNDHLRKIILIVLRFFKSMVLKSLPPISVAWV